jgi:hypothetical protein
MRRDGNPALAAGGAIATSTLAAIGAGTGLAGGAGAIAAGRGTSTSVRRPLGIPIHAARPSATASTPPSHNQSGRPVA